jgi:hypothetical protein
MKMKMKMRSGKMKAMNLMKVGLERAGNPDIMDYGMINNKKMERKANQGEGKMPRGKMDKDYC